MEVKDTLTPDILVEEVTLRSDLRLRPLLSVLEDADEVGVVIVIDDNDDAELLELDEAATEVTKGITEVTTTEEELLGVESLPFSMSTLAAKVEIQGQNRYS